MSQHDTQGFRERYRASVSRFYNPWLHGGFVLAVGLALMAWLIARVDAAQAWEWLAIPAGLIFFSWGEYKIHRGFGHHKQAGPGALFYKRHTGDHHSFFVEELMQPEQARDWRVILFPPWLILVYGLALVLPAYSLLGLLSPNIGALFAASLLAGYLGYEFFHACEHLPDRHLLARLPWIRQMRRLHQLHHRRELMQERNFNLVFPLIDWLQGSLHWEPLAEEPNQMDNRQITHTLLRCTPQAAYDYLTRPGRWKEWHHASLGTEAHALEPMKAGDRFREQIRTVGIRKELLWTVLDAQPGQRWEASATMSDGSRAHLLYEFSAAPEGTRFMRSLGYSVAPLSLRLLNWSLGWAKIRIESWQALRRLQRHFETQRA